MIQKKLILATAASLMAMATSTTLLAARGGEVGGAIRTEAEAAVTTTSGADVQGENTVITQRTQTVSMQNTPVAIYSPPKSSFYAGLGLTLLNNKGFTGLMPKVMAGYGMFYGQDKKFYTGLEIGGGLGSILLSTKNQTYRVSNYVNLSILPGYMIFDNTILYGRLGGQSTRYSRLNSTKNGGVYGLGLEYFYSQNWHTRLEYNYANNRNLNQYIADLIYKFN